MLDYLLKKKHNNGYGLIIQFWTPEIDFKDCETFLLLQDKLSYL